jgi:hypothetical protein
MPEQLPGDVREPDVSDRLRRQKNSFRRRRSLARNAAKKLAFRQNSLAQKKLRIAIGSVGVQAFSVLRQPEG